MKKKEKLKNVFGNQNSNSIHTDYISSFDTFNLNYLMNQGSTIAGGGIAGKLTTGKATKTPHGSDVSVRTYDTDPAKAVTDGVYYPKDNFLFLYEKV